MVRITYDDKVNKDCGCDNCGDSGDSIVTTLESGVNCYYCGGYIRLCKDCTIIVTNELISSLNRR